MEFLVESGNPRAMRVVMGTGYAGPGWVWPKADIALDICSRAVVSQSNGSNAKTQHDLATRFGTLRPLSNAPLWGVKSKPRPLGGVVYSLLNKLESDLCVFRFSILKIENLLLHTLIPDALLMKRCSSKMPIITSNSANSINFIHSVSRGYHQQFN